MQEVIKVRQLTKSYHNPACGRQRKLFCEQRHGVRTARGQWLREEYNDRMYLRHEESRQGGDLRFGNESAERSEKAV